MEKPTIFLIFTLIGAQKTKAPTIFFFNFNFAIFKFYTVLLSFKLYHNSLMWTTQSLINSKPVGINIGLRNQKFSKRNG